MPVPYTAGCGVGAFPVTCGKIHSRLVWPSTIQPDSGTLLAMSWVPIYLDYPCSPSDSTHNVCDDRL